MRRKSRHVFSNRRLVECTTIDATSSNVIYLEVEIRFAVPNEERSKDRTNPAV